MEYIGIIIVVFVIAIICLLGFEQHDKERRAREGLPPKKYHDITDKETEVYFVVRDK